MNKYLEGCKKLPDGRYRLIEKLVISKDTIVKKIPLQEKTTTRLLEHELPVFNTYTIKLWAKNSKNKNDRNYSLVFDSVIKENKVTIGFMDHPEDGAESYKDIVLVGKNPRILFDEETQEDWLCVDITFVGKPHGENCEAVLEAGGFIEFSSSALGDVDEDGYVLADGFFLERYADVVVNSSNGQLFYKTKEEPRSVPTKDTDLLYDNNKVTEKKNITIYKDTIKESIQTGEKTMNEKLNEKALELNIKSLIRDAEKVENLFEKKKQLEVAKEYAMNLTEATLANQISEMITTIDNSISELAEKGKDVHSLNETIENLNKEKQSLTEDIETLKKEKDKIQENYEALIKLYEDKQYESSENEMKINKMLNLKIKTLKGLLEKKNKEILKEKEKKSYFEALANSKVDTNEFIKLKNTVKALQEKLNESNSKNVSLRKQNSELLETIQELRKKNIKEKRFNRVEPRFKTLAEKTQYNRLIKEDESIDDDYDIETILKNKKESLKESTQDKPVYTEKEPQNNGDDNVVENILAQKGFI